MCLGNWKWRDLLVWMSLLHEKNLGQWVNLLSVFFLWGTVTNLVEFEILVFVCLLVTNEISLLMSSIPFYLILSRFCNRPVRKYVLDMLIFRRRPIISSIYFLFTSLNRQFFLKIWIRKFCRKDISVWMFLLHEKYMNQGVTCSLVFVVRASRSSVLGLRQNS